VGPSRQITYATLIPTGLLVAPGTSVTMGLFFLNCGNATLLWSQERGRLVVDLFNNARVRNDISDLESNTPNVACVSNAR